MSIYKTCLLIDDNYIDNFVTRKILESGEFAEKVIVSQSAPDAIESLRSGAIKPAVPNVVSDLVRSVFPSSSLAKPKSLTSGSPRLSSRMLPARRVPDLRGAVNLRNCAAAIRSNG